MWLSASDALLALACAYGWMRLANIDLQAPIRWATRAGIGLIGLAAAIGALRFGGLHRFADVHQFLSAQSAIVAMPLLAIAVFAHRTGPTITLPAVGRARVLYVLLGLFVVNVLLQQRDLAALLSLATLATLIGLQPRQSRWPALLLAGLLAACGVRAWTALPLEHRMIGLHLVLAIWLVVYVRSLEHATATARAAQASTA